MVTILGVGNPIHDTGAAIIEDGKIVAAINEGRLSREKRELRFPSSAINTLLENISSIDKIAISSVGNRSFYDKIQIERKQSDSFSSLVDVIARSIYSSFENDKEKIIHENAKSLVDETDISDSLAKIKSKTEYIDHHRAHAASAYYTSGFDEATIITVDSAGDGLSSTAWHGQNGKLNQFAKNDLIDSLGVIWSLMPTVFGFKGSKHAGKFMGMAPYCNNIPDKLEQKFQELIQVNGFNLTNTFSREHRNKNHEQRVIELKSIFGQYEPPEVARALQERTEQILTEMATKAISETNCKNLALAGGVFANVKVNQRIYELEDVKKFFVHQNMGDGGLSVGAALDVWNKTATTYRPNLLENVYLGPSYNNEQVRNAIERIDIPNTYNIKYFDNKNQIADAASDLLANGKVVNLYTGRMEYGPRALGNRSILYQATDPTSIKWLNEKLDRTEFMPFAPVTLFDHADECYIGYTPELCPAAEFMTITFDCTKKMQQRSPGAVHIDGTARPQIIRKDTNEFYHNILNKYHEKTNIPTLINTSFNMHGEPIVCKPTEAIRSFLNFGTKALVLENFLITKEDK